VVISVQPEPVALITVSRIVPSLPIRYSTCWYSAMLSLALIAIPHFGAFGVDCSRSLKGAIAAVLSFEGARSIFKNLMKKFTFLDELAQIDESSLRGQSEQGATWYFR